MTSQTLPIPKDFPKVLLVLVGMNFQLWWAGKQVSNLRKKIFNKEFMQKNFGEIHRKQLNQEIQPSGYPDSGNGIYSQKLSYSDWYRFNVLQRIHLNYLQNFNWATLAVVSSGLVKTNYGVGVGISYMIARLIYSISYKREKGASNPGRIFGVALSYLTCLTGVGILLYHLAKK